MPESPEACNFVKKEALTQLFSCEFCEISKNTFFLRTPPVAASDERKYTFVLLIFSYPMTIAQIYEILERQERVSIRLNFLYFLFVTSSVFVVY